MQFPIQQHQRCHLCLEDLSFGSRNGLGRKMFLWYCVLGHFIMLFSRFIFTCHDLCSVNIKGIVSSDDIWFLYISFFLFGVQYMSLPQKMNVWFQTYGLFWRMEYSVSNSGDDSVLKMLIFKKCLMLLHLVRGR